MSPKIDRCPKCMGLLEDDGSCSCGYRATKPKSAGDGTTGQLCAFLDQGRSCGCKGIISNSTNGAGKFYCREHWDVVNNRTPGGRGNYVPKPVGRSMDVRQWDGWKYNPKSKRLERMGEPMPRSEADRERDERELREWLDTAVPEEAGQA